jgi:S-adenosylmethionine:tRNA ribosyltransferase-isomerase
MNISELDYPLPEELIAQQPVEPRESCRLMVIHRETGTIDHKHFTDISLYLRKGDLLVLNTAKVTPARLYATCKELNNRKFEILVLDRFDESRCTALVNPSRKIREGMKLIGFKTNETISILNEVGEGQWEIGLEDKIWKDLLKDEGYLALPPYILKTRPTKSEVPEDREWYQTTYSDRDGAIAAPTAGLHFSNDILMRLQQSGIDIAKLFLKVGMGTFQPIRTDNIDEHELLSEEFDVNETAAKQISNAKNSQTRVIGVGTTVVRTLEFLARNHGNISASKGSTNLFIKPPFDFKMVDGLITNFHLPKTTLLALVYAFGGTELIKRAYEEAVLKKYRFFSYGDAMLIL